MLAPGGAQLLFVLAVREAGPSRASVIAGAAPLVAVTVAILALGEPTRVPLVAGAVLIVAGGLALVAERDRPEHFRAIGLVYAFGCTVLFATRDNVVRHIASDSTVAPQLAAAATILSGTVIVFVVLLVARRSRVFRDIRREGPTSCCRASCGARRTRSSSRPSIGRACRSSARSWRRSRSSRSCWPCFSCAAPSWSAGISCWVQASWSPAAR